MDIQEKCGVFAINNVENASSYCSLALHSLQHRGQEGAGVALRLCDQITASYITGKVNEHFNELSKLQGQSAIGHVRYSTSGKKSSQSLKQPICAQLALGPIALAHNGNLVNALEVRTKLMKMGCIFQSDVDTEVLIHLIATSTKTNFIDRIIDAAAQVKGAYSLIIMTVDMIIGIRDPFGIRPLALGKLNKSYVISSESCAFDTIGAQFIRDISPGEVVIINHDNDIQSIYPFPKQQQKFCIFEYIYFARPDSIIDGLSVYEARKAIGRQMAYEEKLNLNNKDLLIVPVPDSGIPAALGYAQESKLPFEFGIIRNHYVGRTFIEPTNSLRKLSVKLKHNANKHVVKDKKIILVDDSIVRGNTSHKIVKLIREAGAKEVHMRISSPPITHPCFYGIDTPERSKLIAANEVVEEIAKFIEADSLQFISIKGLYKAVNNRKSYCDACFTGGYIV